MSNPEIIINAELGGSVEISSEITAAANLTPIIEETQIVCEVIATGPQGPEGPAGQGLIPGGTTGQVLAKKSNTNYDTEWVNPGGGGATPYDSSPEALGTASPGASNNYARGDHVHPMPTPADIGIGTVFNIKGDVAAVADLPSTGNAVGDVYYVQAVSAAYVWLETTAHPTGYWEEFGEPIDLSGYIEKPSSPTANQYLKWDGSAWVAADAPVTSVNGSTGAVSLSIPSTASDVGAEPAVTEVTISTAGAVTQTLDAGKIYHFTGALTALTITLNAAGAGIIPHYHFDFNSGSTATSVTIPNTVTMPDGHSFEASKHYEVDILNNYGAVMSWASS